MHVGTHYIENNYKCLREHVIKSTCDENVDRLTLGWGGVGCKVLQHYHRTKSTLGFIYVFHQVLTHVETDFRLLNPLISKCISITLIVSVTAI